MQARRNIFGIALHGTGAHDGPKDPNQKPVVPRTVVPPAAMAPFSAPISKFVLDAAKNSPNVLIGTFDKPGAATAAWRDWLLAQQNYIDQQSVLDLAINGGNPLLTYSTMQPFKDQSVAALASDQEIANYIQSMDGTTFPGSNKAPQFHVSAIGDRATALADYKTLKKLADKDLAALQTAKDLMAAHLDINNQASTDDQNVRQADVIAVALAQKIVDADPTPTTGNVGKYKGFVNWIKDNGSSTNKFGPLKERQDWIVQQKQAVIDASALQDTTYTTLADFTPALMHPDAKNQLSNDGMFQEYLAATIAVRIDKWPDMFLAQYIGTKKFHIALAAAEKDKAAALSKKNQAGQGKNGVNPDGKPTTYHEMAIDGSIKQIAWCEAAKKAADAALALDPTNVALQKAQEQADANLAISKADDSAGTDFIADVRKGSDANRKGSTDALALAGGIIGDLATGSDDDTATAAAYATASTAATKHAADMQASYVQWQADAKKKASDFAATIDPKDPNGQAKIDAYLVALNKELADDLVQVNLAIDAANTAAAKAGYFQKIAAAGAAAVTASIPIAKAVADIHAEVVDQGKVILALGNSVIEKHAAAGITLSTDQLKQIQANNQTVYKNTPDLKPKDTTPPPADKGFPWGLLAAAVGAKLLFF